MKRIDPARLDVVPPDREQHGEEAVELVAKGFSGYYTIRSDAGCHVFGQGYDRQVSRVGLLAGQLVTHWGVIDRTVRIGTASVRVGGATSVITHGDYRKRGLMRRTGLACLEAMRNAGYDLTMLFGILDYYDQYGYVNAYPETTYTVQIADLLADRTRPALRAFSDRYMDGLTTLYNKTHARCTGTAIRSTFPLFHWPHGSPRMKRLLWLKSRRPAGYVIAWGRGDALVCYEHAGDADTVLRVLKHLADEGEHRRIRFETLHAVLPLASRLRRMNCTVETTYARSGGAMIHVLNLLSTLSKLRRELSRRLKRSPFDGWRGSLLIANPREKVTLVISRGQVRVAPPTGTKHAIRGGEAIGRLILGSDDPDAVIDAGGIRTTGDARMLARVLFPSQHPSLCMLDGY